MSSEPRGEVDHYAQALASLRNAEQMHDADRPGLRASERAIQVQSYLLEAQVHALLLVAEELGQLRV